MVDTDQSVVLVMELEEQTTWKAGVNGTIAIYPDDLQAETGNREYSIKMKARSTHWFYYILNRSRIKLNSPVITNYQGLEFSDPEEVTLSGGEKALRFTSGDNEFQFQETSEIKMNFVNYPNNQAATTDGSGNSKGRTLIKGLPVSSINRIGVLEQEGQQIQYSEIYAYL